MSAGWDAAANSVDFTLPVDLRSFERFVPRSARVLDFGCGYGRITALLRDRGYVDVQGYDASAAMIARGVRIHPALKLAPCLPSAIPEPPASFDAAVLCALLTSIAGKSERADVIRELLRVLKPGGVVHVAEVLRGPAIAYSCGGTFEWRPGITMKHFEQSELVQLFADFDQLAECRVDAASLSGAPIVALHYFGRKRVESS